ncbi:MAG: restriction endonuclease subunit S [Ignavibacteria bacterium]|nr:restriction endonuclease subunit S [Ignavibacteria bacterium]
MSEWKETEFGQIPAEWEFKTISSIKSNEKGAISMGPFGSNIKAENFVSSGVPVIRGSNLNYDKFVNGEFVYLTEEKADELKGSNCKAGDLVFTHRGTIGQVGIIPEGKFDRYVISQSGMKLSVDPKLIDKEFLFYFFKSKYGQFQLLKTESQVGVPSISNPLTSLKAIEVPVPKLSEQAAIAEVLNSLDDKIDLLHLQNKTLEQLAETLFRQWFLEEAEEGWEEKGIDEIAEFLNGLACQKYPVKIGEVGLPVIKIKELRTGITDSSDLATNDIPEKYLVNNGDMLFSWSGSLDILIWSGEKGVLNQHLFKVSSDVFPQWFYYFWVKYHLPEFQGIAEDKATTMGHIQRHHLTSAKVLIPPKEKLIEKDKTINSIFEKIKINQIQIRTLTQLRDTLLPKLVSGEVRVKI